MEKDHPDSSNKKKAVLQALKFTLFSAGAGIIQFGSFTLLYELASFPEWLAHLIALTLSVLFNFTLNRKFTFKAANNVAFAMFLAGVFYLVFTPLSTIYMKVVSQYINPYFAEISVMLINLVLEFLYTKFIVYGLFNKKLKFDPGFMHYLVPLIICRFNEILGFLTIYQCNKAKDVVYERKIRYCEDKKLYLNVCQPKNRDSKALPVLVYIHGGGWISGRPEYREAFVANVASQGFFTVNIFYGYSPKYGHPYAVENIYKALGWLRENAEKYHIDLDRIYVAGESAGAHLTALVAAVSSNTECRAGFTLPEWVSEMKLKGVILNCGIYDMISALDCGFPFIKSYIYAYYRRPLKFLKEDENEKYLSPIRFVTPEWPKTFIISAEHDKLRTGSYQLARRLDENDVTYFHVEGTGGTAVHAFLVAQGLKVSRRIMQDVYDFIMEK